MATCRDSHQHRSLLTQPPKLRQRVSSVPTLVLAVKLSPDFGNINKRTIISSFHPSIHSPGNSPNIDWAPGICHALGLGSGDPEITKTLSSRRSQAPSDFGKVGEMLTIKLRDCSAWTWTIPKMITFSVSGTACCQHIFHLPPASLRVWANSFTNVWKTITTLQNCYSCGLRVMMAKPCVLRGIRGWGILVSSMIILTDDYHRDHHGLRKYKYTEHTRFSLSLCSKVILLKSSKHSTRAWLPSLSLCLFLHSSASCSSFLAQLKPHLHLPWPFWPRGFTASLTALLTCIWKSWSHLPFKFLFDHWTLGLVSHSTSTNPTHCRHSINDAVEKKWPSYEIRVF